MNKTPLVQSAAATLQEIVGSTVRYDQQSGSILLEQDAAAIALPVRVVEQMSRATLAELIHTHAGTKTVIVAPHLTREQLRQLQEAGVNYIDSGGNVRVHTSGVIVHVEGARPAESPSYASTAGRAFQPAGLKVLFALLVDPSRINESYRDLAKRVEVSVGTVKHVLDDLERRGNVIKIGRRRGMTRRLTGVKELARRWASSYSDILRPKLVRGRFRFLEPDQYQRWRDLKLDQPETCWGGEAAADLYAGHLRAEVLSLYTRATTASLAKTLQIVPADDGPVEILDKFWKDDIRFASDLAVVPLVMAYADLLASSETRNTEAAQPLLNAWADAEIDQ